MKHSSNLLREANHGHYLHQAYGIVLRDQELQRNPQRLRVALHHILASNPYDNHEQKLKALQALHSTPDSHLLHVTERAHEIAGHHTTMALAQLSSK